jgi:hypothetical protein
VPSTALDSGRDDLAHPVGIEGTWGVLEPGHRRDVVARHCCRDPELRLLLTSRGLPRSVNNIAWQSLIGAFTQDKDIVDESSARLAITETHTGE